MSGKQKVAYFYDPDIGSYAYGPKHPMKPHRVKMCHSLILHYNLYKELDVYRPVLASPETMMEFHSPDYINFLQNVSPQNQDALEDECRKFMVGSDCPAFEGLFPYCQKYAGGSIGGAVKLNQQTADIVINWAGGLHHAKKAEASGFCYVNDIVLGILELLKYHARVLYIDIDVHHGDGVEEAFYASDRVMTLSFHKFGDDFFPGTGGRVCCGAGAGKGYALNVPLKAGMTDQAYFDLFKPVTEAAVERFRPDAIVFQSGADSVGGDRLGSFNLTTKGHGRCLQRVKEFGLPMMILGGGGYLISNVARLWAYETGVALGRGDEMEDKLPPNEYITSYAEDFKLHFPIKPQDQVVNLNTAESIGKLKAQVIEHLSRISPPGGVGFYERAPDAYQEEDLQAQDMRNGYSERNGAPAGSPDADGDADSDYGAGRSSSDGDGDYDYRGERMRRGRDDISYRQQTRRAGDSGRNGSGAGPSGAGAGAGAGFANGAKPEYVGLVEKTESDGMNRDSGSPGSYSDGYEDDEEGGDRMNN